MPHQDLCGVDVRQAAPARLFAHNDWAATKRTLLAEIDEALATAPDALELMGGDRTTFERLVLRIGPAFDRPELYEMAKVYTDLPWECLTIPDDRESIEANRLRAAGCEVAWLNELQSMVRCGFVRRHCRTVTFVITGGGHFVIPASQRALRDFRCEVSRRWYCAKPDVRRNVLGTATRLPKVQGVSPLVITEQAQRFVMPADEAERRGKVGCQQVVMDGRLTVASDVSRMTILFGGGPAISAAKVGFPNWRAALPVWLKIDARCADFSGFSGTPLSMDVATSLRHIFQIGRCTDVFTKGVGLHAAGGRCLLSFENIRSGVSFQPEDLPDNSPALALANVEFLRDVLECARVLGVDTVTVYLGDDRAPIIMDLGGRGVSLIMPIRRD